MSKGQLTRQHIIEQAAAVFNEKGYAATSMSDIMQVTGLRKGGIYNHFSSKDELALAAFDYAFAYVNQRLIAHIAELQSPLAQLEVFISTFRMYEKEAIFVGGCPILNTAVEAVDTHPQLRDKALQALETWNRFMTRRLERAIAQGEARPDIDIPATTTLIIASLEGAVMLTRIYGQQKYVEQVVQHLLNMIEHDIRL